MNKKIILMLLCCLLPLSACLEKKQHAENSLSTIEIHDAYAFATMPGGATGAAFMTIKNLSDSDINLISAQSDIAKITEIHQNLIDPDDGTMMMRKIPSLNIPAHGETILEPKGYHIMFIQLKEPLTIGQTIPLTLEFESNYSVTIDVKILTPGMGLNTDHSH